MDGEVGAVLEPEPQDPIGVHFGFALSGVRITEVERGVALDAGSSSELADAKA
ncbi:hypothetical protein [Arthrobacter sp. S39]|uniref:hypothetical protein n=1 Tax=Arthrobacter sp. S39 TaxID=2509720 RepID=UPI0013EF7F80|nr:hypothetical protein [Arthrobacter sp. S39]